MPCLTDMSAMARTEHLRLRSDRCSSSKGEALTYSMVDLEVLYSTRNRKEHSRVRTRRALAYRKVELTEAIFRRAIDVQGLLARHGRHRLPIPDLVIAAAAESARMTVLHYDADFDTIAAVTGQDVEWIVLRGSL